MKSEETGAASKLVASDAEPTDFDSESQYDLSALTLSDVVRCGYFFRQMAIHSKSMEEMVNGIVNHLFDSCKNPETGENDITLVRFFKTHSFGDLDQSLQESAQALAPDSQLKANTKCLILLATAGERSQWNDRHQSAGHRAIPLLSESAVSQNPDDCTARLSVRVRLISRDQSDTRFTCGTGSTALQRLSREASPWQPLHSCTG